MKIMGTKKKNQKNENYIVCECDNSRIPYILNHYDNEGYKFLQAIPVNNDAGIMIMKVINFYKQFLLIMMQVAMLY
jgi:hypothetical protein